MEKSDTDYLLQAYVCPTEKFCLCQPNSRATVLLICSGASSTDSQYLQPKCPIADSHPYRKWDLFDQAKCPLMFEFALNES
jgi:hypothetical protein